MTTIQELRKQAMEAENNQLWALAVSLWLEAIDKYPTKGKRAEAEKEKMKCRALAALLMQRGI